MVSGPLRILVIDDNQAAADALVRLLTLRGHSCEAVYSGQEALPKASVFLPHVVLLDIGLPDIEGYEVARSLRKEPACADTVLIALTGYGQESDIEKAKEAGFNHHLTKPASLKDIEEALGQVA